MRIFLLLLCLAVGSAVAWQKPRTASVTTPLAYNNRNHNHNNIIRNDDDDDANQNNNNIAWRRLTSSNRHNNYVRLPTASSATTAILRGGSSSSYSSSSSNRRTATTTTTSKRPSSSQTSSPTTSSKRQPSTSSSQTLAHSSSSALNIYLLAHAAQTVWKWAKFQWSQFTTRAAQWVFRPNNKHPAKHAQQQYYTKSVALLVAIAWASAELLARWGCWNDASATQRNALEQAIRSWTTRIRREFGSFRQRMRDWWQQGRKRMTLHHFRTVAPKHQWAVGVVAGSLLLQPAVLQGLRQSLWHNGLDDGARLFVPLGMIGMGLEFYPQLKRNLVEHAAALHQWLVHHNFGNTMTKTKSSSSKTFLSTNLGTAILWTDELLEYARAWMRYHIWLVHAWCTELLIVQPEEEHENSAERLQQLMQWARQRVISGVQSQPGVQGVLLGIVLGRVLPILPIFSG